MGVCCSKFYQERTNQFHTELAGEDPAPTPTPAQSQMKTNCRIEQLCSSAPTKSLIRVGSQRTLNSPHRSSNYIHVENAVFQNFSAAGALLPTSDGYQARARTGTNHVPLGVVGLKNLGNTCFLNSSLQCLSATIPLTDYFLGYDYRRELNSSNPLGTGGALATQYAELMKAMWLGPSQLQQQQSRKRVLDARHNGKVNCQKKTAVIKPSSFKAALETFAPQFVGCRQHDAQELLAYLLDGIHEDLNRIQQKPYIEDPDFDGSNDDRDAATAWMNYLKRDKSLIVDIFQGQVKNKRKCCMCHHVNVKFEPFMYLSVPISDQCQTLDDCVRLYLQGERLVGDNQWYCAKCKRHRDATQETALWILPPILILHLKRFKFTDSGHLGSKNNASIDYPFMWDLAQFVPFGGTTAYDLYAVSNHVGGMGNGHYTAYVKNRFDDAWYEFNDSSWHTATEETLRQNRSSAYLLFYNRAEETPPNVRTGESWKHPHRYRAPLIRRQSVSRPDLWPHAQVLNNQFREFSRQSARSISDQTPLTYETS